MDVGDTMLTPDNMLLSGDFLFNSGVAGTVGNFIHNDKQ